MKLLRKHWKAGWMIFCACGCLISLVKDKGAKGENLGSAKTTHTNQKFVKSI